MAKKNPTEPLRRRPIGTRAVTVRLLSIEDVDATIRGLRLARRTSLRRGGNVHVTVHDSKCPDVRCHLLVDLTTDAFGRRRQRGPIRR